MVILSICTTEYQGKWALRRHARPGASWPEFKKEYGEPRYTYRSWNSLPQAYQQLFGEATPPEDMCHAFQMEGLPSYWSFVVSVDSQARTIHRYIHWNAIALKPRKDI